MSTKAVFMSGTLMQSAVSHLTSMLSSFSPISSLRPAEFVVLPKAKVSSYRDLSHCHVPRVTANCAVPCHFPASPIFSQIIFSFRKKDTRRCLDAHNLGKREPPSKACCV